jgi:hypothetical protein
LITSRQLDDVREVASDYPGRGGRMIVTGRRVDSLRASLVHDPDLLLLLRRIVGSSADASLVVH